MKKTVKPTTDPTKFDIELDVIGGTNRTTNKIDVVFVMDKSGSMVQNNSPRWNNLKTELAKFSKDLIESSFETGNIKMGLVAFGDNQVGEVYTPYASISDFGAPSRSNTVTVGFTDDFTKFDGHNPGTRHKIFDTTPNGGTPLFLGIDAGIELLKNASYGARDDARKVLIVLSDGIATYAPRTSNYSLQTHFQTNLQKSRVDQNSSLQFSTTRSGQNARGVQFVGNGQSDDANLLSEDGGTNVIGLTNAYIENRRPNSSTILPILPISIGFSLGGDYVTQVRGILRNFAGSSTTDPNSNFYDASVDDLGLALDKIRTLILTMNDVIREGTITDPMSEYVSLIDGSLQTYALSLDTTTDSLSSLETTAIDAPVYAKNAVVNQSVDSMAVSNLYLGGKDAIRYGYRLTYTVQLKEAYQDGLFYPANQRTTVTADNIEDPLDFAIPSIRYIKNIAIPVEKIWDDDNNDWNTRQAVTLQLQKQQGTQWINVTNGTFSIAKDATGEELKTVFLNLPAYEGGHKIDYRVIENPARVPGYGAGVALPLSVNSASSNYALQITNQLKKVPLDKFTKINQMGHRLAGVKFQLFHSDGTTAIGAEKTSGINGEVDFSAIQLPIGSYLLKETASLPGYEPMADRMITVSDSGTENAELIVSGLDDVPEEVGNQIVNQLRLFTLKVIKEDDFGRALEGAEFALKQVLPAPETVISGTINQNEFTYTGLFVGSYVLTETSAPHGYIGVEPMTITIATDGKVTVDGVEQEQQVTEEGERLITLVVKNRKSGKLPSTGGYGTQPFIDATLILTALLGFLTIYYIYRNRKGGRAK